MSAAPALAVDDLSVEFRTRSGVVKVLEQVGFTIAKGETVALVGGSGGGKTTLVNLLPRFYAPSSGRVLLDGHDLQTVTLDSLRANIALVSQEIVLFNDSIFANIAYGGMSGAPEKDVIAAAEAAHAMAFIRETPDGLNTQIGESGLRLSGGQRQRLAIARAIMAGFSSYVAGSSQSPCPVPFWLLHSPVSSNLPTTRGRSPSLRL